MSSHHAPGFRFTRGSTSFVASLGVLALAGCSANTDDLFGSSGGAGGTGSTGAQPTSSVSTGSMSTGSMSTGSMSTGSMSTGSMSTGSMSTGSMSTGSMSTGSMSTGSTTSTGSGMPHCGDGVVNTVQEQCDGADHAGHDCTEMGFVDPAGLTCTAGCLLDFTGCKNHCGNGTVEPGEQCDDGNTNALDGCSNMCQSQGTTCMTAIPVNVAVGSMLVSADTIGNGMFTSSGCQNASGPELVYAMKATSAGFLTVWTDPVTTDYDALVYVRGGASCFNGNELACGDNITNEPDLLSIPVQQNQTVFVFVDGFQGDKGHFDLHVDLSAGTCADPVPILVGDAGFNEDAKGSTEGQGADGSGVCGGLGQDVVYAVTRLTQGNVKVTTTPTAPGFKSVTHARTSCGDPASEIACNNNPTPATQTSTITANNVDTTTPTFVWVDGTLGQQGAYTVSFGK